MKLYLSGPMTGKPDHNKPAFDAAAADLRGRGYEVVSPVELDHNSGVELGSPDGYTVSDDDYAKYLERDFEALADCDGVVFIKGWETSGGAGREGRYAIQLGLYLYLYSPDNPILLQMPRNFFLAYSTTERKLRSV